MVGLVYASAVGSMPKGEKVGCCMSYKVVFIVEHLQRETRRLLLSTENFQCMVPFQLVGQVLFIQHFCSFFHPRPESH